jgi:hypothetical protein
VVTDRFQFLLKINNAIASILDLHELIPAISKILRPIMDHDGAAIGIYSEEKDELRIYSVDPVKDIQSIP